MTKKSIKLKDEKKLDPRVFDEHWINGQWGWRVKQCFNSDNYDVYWKFDGILYGWRNPIADPTFAVAFANQYLQYRYKNKSLFVAA